MYSVCVCVQGHVGVSVELGGWAFVRPLPVCNTMVQPESYWLRTGSKPELNWFTLVLMNEREEEAGNLSFDPLQ